MGFDCNFFVFICFEICLLERRIFSTTSFKSLQSNIHVAVIWKRNAAHGDMCDSSGECGPPVYKGRNFVLIS